MRSLSDTEKNLILRLVRERNRAFLFPNMIDHLLPGIRIAAHLSEARAEFLLPDALANSTGLGDTIDRISWDLITAVNLIDYLHREGYILLIQTANEIDDPFEFGPGISNIPTTPFQFPDNNIARLLTQYVNRSIVATQPLIDYVNNDYKTNDEVENIKTKNAESMKHKQTMKVAWSGIYASIGIGLSGFLLTIILTLTNDTKLDKNQFKSIEQRFDQATNRMQAIESKLTDINVSLSSRLSPTNQKTKTGDKSKNAVQHK